MKNKGNKENGRASRKRVALIEAKRVADEAQRVADEAIEEPEPIDSIFGSMFNTAGEADTDTQLVHEHSSDPDVQDYNTIADAYAHHAYNKITNADRTQTGYQLRMMELCKTNPYINYATIAIKSKFCNTYALYNLNSLSDFKSIIGDDYFAVSGKEKHTLTDEQIEKCFKIDITQVLACENDNDKVQDRFMSKDYDNNTYFAFALNKYYMIFANRVVYKHSVYKSCFTITKECYTKYASTSDGAFSLLDSQDIGKYATLKITALEEHIRTTKTMPSFLSN